MSVRQLIVDGITVPTYAASAITQRFEELKAVSTPRLADGSASQRELWSGKWRIVTNGGSLAPSGLQNLAYGASFSMSCVESLAINSASNVINIPSARRSDAGSEPIGFAEVGGILIPTAVAMSVDQATLTPVSGADQYQVRWFPVLTVVLISFNQELRRGSGTGWQLVCEEA